MKNFAFTLLLFLTTLSIAYTQNSITTYQVYGQLYQDYGRANKIILLPDGNFLIGGVWNKKGYLAIVNKDGLELNKHVFENEFSGNSRISDITLDDNGDIVAVGECDHCNGADTLEKVIAIKAAINLEILQTRQYNGTDVSLNRLFNPHIVLTNEDKIVVVSTVSNNSFNFEDILLFELSTDLSISWQKQLNSCGNCGFDHPLDAAATENGFATIVENAFTDSATVYTFDHQGNTIWKRRYYRPGGYTNAGMAVRNGVIYVGVGIPPPFFDPTHTVASVGGMSVATGDLVGLFTLNTTFENELIRDIQFSSDGTLLVAYQQAALNPFGTYAVSRVYRVNVQTFQTIDYVELPNPDNITSILINSVVPVSADGKDLAAVGSHGLNFRPFFYGRRAVSGLLVPRVADDPGIQIMPNPASGACRISTGNMAGQSITIQIFDLTGRLIHTQSTTADPQIQLDLGHIPNGRYQVQLCSKDKTAVKQLIIQHE